MNAKMNFTGKAKLTDEEFILFYDQLWEKVPHKSLNNEPTKAEILKRKKAREKIYNNSTPAIRENEVWEYFPGNMKYLVSSEGRIKYEVSDNIFELIQQDDYDSSKPGYLVLKPSNTLLRVNKTRKSYVFVAMTFLGKIEGDGYHVHHIINNGYDCSTENLILLSASQHDAVHLDRHLSRAELIDFLKERSLEDEIKKHLTSYKLNSLKTEKSGIWKGRYKLPHILSEQDRIQNLIMLSYPEEFKQLYLQQKDSLHSCFAHLNSSQALCFNLFYPLVFCNRLSVINSTISNNSSASFEHVEEGSFEKINDYREKTNFDFFINDNGKKYFFEIKYTEKDFGNVESFAINDGHDKKYNAYYKGQIEKIAASDVSEKDFFDNYQIWRNVCHADIGMVYFVFLKDRKSLEKSVNSIVSQCKDEYKKKINILYIEDLVASCLKIQDENFQKHYQEFKKKYLI